MTKTTANEAKQPPLAVRPAEAARMLSISTQTLYALTQRGELPFRKVGKGVKGARLYAVADLEAWLLRGMQGRS